MWGIHFKKCEILPKRPVVSFFKLSLLPENAILEAHFLALHACLAQNR
jgi:hypothetical protein